MAAGCSECAKSWQLAAAPMRAVLLQLLQLLQLVEGRVARAERDLLAAAPTDALQVEESAMAACCSGCAKSYPRRPKVCYTVG